MLNKTFRLPADLVERLSIVAQNQGVSLNNLVKQCCEYALSNLDTSKESVLKNKKYFSLLFIHSLFSPKIKENLQICGVKNFCVILLLYIRID